MLKIRICIFNSTYIQISFINTFLEKERCPFVRLKKTTFPFLVAVKTNFKGEHTTMGFKDMMKNALKAATSIGKVSGSSFPEGTIINLGTNADGEKQMLFTYPNKEEYFVTRDKVKSAEVLAMGVIDIENNNKGTTTIYGTKYKVELTDGKVAILTVGLGNTLYQIERILF